MKLLKTTTLLIVLVFSASHALAEQVVSGFNGFKWGTNKQTILANHGNPVNVLEWLLTIDDTDLVVGGYKVKKIKYYFDPLHKCNYELPKILHECLLIRGQYLLETTSNQDFIKIKTALEPKYGTPRQEIKEQKLINRDSGEELTNIKFTLMKFPQKDSSLVALWKKDHDKNFVDPKNSSLKKAGTQLIVIEYQSPRFAEVKKIKQKKKDF